MKSNLYLIGMCLVAAAAIGLINISYRKGLERGRSTLNEYVSANCYLRGGRWYVEVKNVDGTAEATHRSLDTAFSQALDKLGQ